MKKLSLLLILMTGFVFAEPVPKVCVKCNKINKWNSEHPNPYAYYEDYLEHKDELEANPFLEEDFELPNES